MDTNTKTIPLHLHPLGFIESFIYFGAKLNDLLKNTGINENMFKRTDSKISYQQQKQLLKNGIRLCNKPGIGLLVGQTMDWVYQGTMGSIVHCSPTLEAAANIFYRYILIAQPYYSMYAHKPKFYIDKNNIVVEPIENFGPYSHDQQVLMFEIEYRLAILLRLYDLCGNKSVKDNSVHVCLSYKEPDHTYLYNNLPCISVKFNCEHSSISCGHGFITEPWRLLRKNAYNGVVEQCETEFQLSNIETSLSAKVRWYISTLYFNKKVTIGEIAHALSMTPRALARKLTEENTNFRKILLDVRMEITSCHLRSSKLHIDDIADLMGFSCTSSLCRAIKNWSGLSAGNLKDEMNFISSHTETIQKQRLS